MNRNDIFRQTYLDLITQDIWNDTYEKFRSQGNSYGQEFIRKQLDFFRKNKNAYLNRLKQKLDDRKIGREDYEKKLSSMNIQRMDFNDLLSRNSDIQKSMGISSRNREDQVHYRSQVKRFLENIGEYDKTKEILGKDQRQFSLFFVPTAQVSRFLAHSYKNESGQNSTKWCIGSSTYMDYFNSSNFYKDVTFFFLIKNDPVMMKEDENSRRFNKIAIGFKNIDCLDSYDNGQFHMIGDDADSGIFFQNAFQDMLGFDLNSEYDEYIRYIHHVRDWGDDDQDQEDDGQERHPRTLEQRAMQCVRKVVNEYVLRFFNYSCENQGKGIPDHVLQIIDRLKNGERFQFEFTTKNAFQVCTKAPQWLEQDFEIIYDEFSGTRDDKQWIFNSFFRHFMTAIKTDDGCDTAQTFFRFINTVFHKMIRDQDYTRMLLEDPLFTFYLCSCSFRKFRREGLQGFHRHR